MLFFNTTIFADLLGICFIKTLNWIIVGLISATTLYSGVEYFIKNFDVLKEKK